MYSGGMGTVSGEFGVSMDVELTSVAGLTKQLCQKKSDHFVMSLEDQDKPGSCL